MSVNLCLRHAVTTCGLISNALTNISSDNWDSIMPTIFTPNNICVGDNNQTSGRGLNGVSGAVMSIFRKMFD